METRSVDLRLADDSIVSGKFRLWEVSPHDPNEVRIELVYSGRELQAQSDISFFDALRTIRSVLEQETISILCLGSCRNIYPSPMIESMGPGKLAYRLEMGKQARKADLVSIFDAGAHNEMEIGTVQEQNDYYDKWFDSLG